MSSYRVQFIEIPLNGGVAVASGRGGFIPLYEGVAEG
jgi:hypothetical protein